MQVLTRFPSENASVAQRQGTGGNASLFSVELAGPFLILIMLLLLISSRCPIRGSSSPNRSGEMVQLIADGQLGGQFFQQLIGPGNKLNTSLISKELLVVEVDFGVIHSSLSKSKSKSKIMSKKMHPLETARNRK